MDSQTYWKNRELEQRKHNIQNEKVYQQHIDEIYANMLDEIEKEIHGFYSRYAKKEGITMAEAKKRVSQLDIEAYARKAKRYVKDKDFSKQANEEMRLYNLTMKVNRLEMLKANIGLHMVEGFDELQKYFEQTLTEETLKEFERQAGILGKSVLNNAGAAHSIVNASFHNATYSERIWMYQDMMKYELSRLLQTGLIQGQNPRKLAAHLRKRFGVSQYNAERLMITELARVQTEAQKQSFERNGFEEYTFLALGDACPACKALDGKHFKVEEMMPGTNAPPMHPACRCSVAAYEDSDDYEAWLDFLSKGGTTAEWERLKNKGKSVAKEYGSGIIRSGGISGALTDKNDPLYVKRDKHASIYYESIRNSKKDPIVKSISKNTGFSEVYVSKVYDHVFINEYELYGGKKRFESDYDMAESFRRLREGKNIHEHDIILLMHEHLEYGLMNKEGLLYDEAHELAQSKYNYKMALDKFKKENEL